MVVLAPWSSLILPSGRTMPLVRGEENPAALSQLSIFLGEQDVLGEGEMGTMHHAWRVGWNFTLGKESCWSSSWCVSACGRPRLLSGSWLGGAGLALLRERVGTGLVCPNGIPDDQPRLVESRHRTLHILRGPICSIVIPDGVFEAVD